MSNHSEFDKPWNYQIRVKGVIDPQWSDWFLGFNIEEADNEDTKFRGSGSIAFFDRRVFFQDFSKTNPGLGRISSP